jgi:ABC-type lipoprotein release transport system permease subunit
MYKIFLCFRYLTRKGIVLFPVLAVWLCVMMLIIVNSIMTGFVNRVRDAGRSLMGDVVIQSDSMAGFPYYRQIQKQLALLPQIKASTPVISGYGLFNLPEFQVNTGVQVMGVKADSESKVSSFGSSLFWQYKAPMQAVQDLRGVGFPASRKKLLAYAQKRLLSAAKEEHARQQAFADLKPISSHAWFASIRRHWQVISHEDYQQAVYKENRADRDLRMVQALPNRSFANAAALRKALVPRAPTFAPPPQAANRYMTASDEPKTGCVIGVDIGLYKRDRFGHYHRPPGVRFSPVIITMVPVTIKATLAQPQSRRFVIVDDSRTRVYAVDSKTVYIPFHVAQKMAFMQQQDLLDGGVRPGRCSEIQVLVRHDSSEVNILAARKAIAHVVHQLELLHPQMEIAGIRVRTWDQVQAEYIRAVDNERNMITFLLGLMSLVVVIVIFLIFYMLVRDKTRDIGIIKAIGGSEEGLGVIFILYGMLISSAGAILGLFTGVWFVRNDNWIHDHILWRIFGISIWNRKIYVFSKIPDQVDPHAVMWIVIFAILAGLLGALIPAIIAARQDPVEALRYE